ncbi:hypothetical protein O3P69_019293 [Scylla paramamosain]|uniref:Transmembrane protein 94 n=1 Tax=Scylla paramamosain TaxID=85552 RepID=A0AAW0SX93_SCYPA
MEAEVDGVCGGGSGGGGGGSDGLTTREALGRLHDDINAALEHHHKTQEHWSRGCGAKTVLFEALHHKCQLALFHWTSALGLLLCAAALLVAYAASGDDRLLQGGVGRGLEYQETVQWEPANYPHLHTPLSPCITLQWTRRDGHIVNLPWSLLVRGDIILLRPGQRVPGRCRLLQTTTTTTTTTTATELQMGEVYSPHLEGIGEVFNSPKERVPLPTTPYLLLETPYVFNVETLLAEALNRPVTVFNRLRHAIFTVAIENLALPIVVFMALLINGVRLYYGGWGGHWGEALLGAAVGVALPLLPLSLPLAWLALNWLGTGRILAMYHQAGRLESEPIDDPFEEADLEGLRPGNMGVVGGEVRTHTLASMCGTYPAPTRTANILHALASVTNLCCVDKKGVLSWPNPTAEKVFFLKNRGHNLINTSVASFYGDEEMVEDEGHLQRSLPTNNTTKESESVLMSLTHDHQTAFGLQFDDPSWQRYLLSLKPLGLNILLNTCNPATQHHYTQFCAHITCEAMFNEDLVPVSQRRCLCELAKQIGFSQRAQQPFELEHQLSTFRHVPPDMARKDRLARSLITTKLKFPFPHMMSVLVRDRASRKLELMSQGTADIILDSCTDYWDGYDVCPLTDKDRKKILDFYHRTSLSAYCTAFSYRPTSCVVRQELSEMYMELPLDPSHLYMATRTPTPHISTEALFGDHHHTEYEEVDDVEDAFRMQCKQIFIGMVTMQYQAKTDMVQMIEQLDASCIRFQKMGLESGWNCHISLLSDRTRTESGNSSRAGQVTGSAKTSGLTLFRQSNEDLGSPDLAKAKFRSSLEVSRGLSHSAPSAINLEVAQISPTPEAFCKGEEEEEDEEDEEEEVEEEVDSEESRLGNFGYRCDGGTSEECIMLGEEEDEEEEEEKRRRRRMAGGDEGEDSSQGSHSRSPSRVTDSTERSTFTLFDKYNRARLPKGIENIKPHLENVDNVPLLVSLFTDCTPPTTRAMLTLMQEYTEVTVVMGSSANADNMPLFMQADASLSVDPLYPQVCMREAVSARPSAGCGPGPEEVAKTLNVLPCSLALTPHSRVSLVSLIMEARHFMQQVMSCFQFWACCCLSLSLLQLLAATAALPPLLSSGDILWLVVVIIPALSLSLVAAPTNPSVMNQATGKNTVLFDKQVLRDIIKFYVCKFCCVGLLLVYYFCAISVSFVHRMYTVWKRNPLRNRCWAATVFAVLVVQAVYSCVSLSVAGGRGSEEREVPGLSAVPAYLWPLSLLWPLLALPLNEFIKHKEIRINVRYQKKARLLFGTKLGMNSPF